MLYSYDRNNFMYLHCHLWHVQINGKDYNHDFSRGSSYFLGSINVFCFVIWSRRSLLDCSNTFSVVHFALKFWEDFEQTLQSLSSLHLKPSARVELHRAECVKVNLHSIIYSEKRNVPPKRRSVDLSQLWSQTRVLPSSASREMDFLHVRMWSSHCLQSHRC